MPQVLKLLAESVCQSGEPSHAHSHREILAFDIAGRDMLRIGVARDRMRLASDAIAGTVASIIGRVAVELNKHRVVNVTTECAFYRLQVGSVAVCCNLYAILQPAREIINELVCSYRVTPSVMPARN